MGEPFPDTFEVIDFGGLVLQRADAENWTAAQGAAFISDFYAFLAGQGVSCGGGWEAVPAGQESYFSRGHKALNTLARLGLPPDKLEESVLALVSSLDWALDELKLSLGKATWERNDWEHYGPVVKARLALAPFAHLGGEP